LDKGKRAGIEYSDENYMLRRFAYLGDIFVQLTDTTGAEATTAVSYVVRARRLVQT